jgi:hypothetical protein
MFSACQFEILQPPWNLRLLGLLSKAPKRTCPPYWADILSDTSVCSHLVRATTIQSKAIVDVLSPATMTPLACLQLACATTTDPEAIVDFSLCTNQVYSHFHFLESTTIISRVIIWPPIPSSTKRTAAILRKFSAMILSALRSSTSSPMSSATSLGIDVSISKPGVSLAVLPWHCNIHHDSKEWQRSSKL